MEAVEITEVKCDGCGCAITPELHEARSGEFELSFFVCPFCHRKYAIYVTDGQLRKDIAEYCELREAAEKDQLSDREIDRMKELRIAKRQRARMLRELYVPKETSD